MTYLKAVELIDLGKKTEIEINSYMVSYPYILSYFSKLKEISAQDIVIGAHMIYGWMPTVLTMHVGSKNPEEKLKKAATILAEARKNKCISKDDMGDLVRVINHSVVGASKLLHFIAPEDFAIWDSKIYSFMHREKPHGYRVNNIQRYFEYLDTLKEIKAHSGFSTFHEIINNKVGYKVSAIRAIELIMFLNSKGK